MDPEAHLPDLRKAPAERWPPRVLPAAGIVWSAAEIMHWAGRPGVKDLAIGAAAVYGLASWLAYGRDRIPRWVPGLAGITGAWLTAAASFGPLDWWPYPVLTIGWAVIAWRVRRWARGHPAVTEAQEWRAQRAEWLGRSHRWGLRGSHLLDFGETRLGVRYTVSTKGTGKRASQIASGGTAELIAEDEDLPLSRVEVRKHRIAGRAEILIRYEDPWADPIPHPVLAENPEIDLSGPFSIRDAAVVGQDPETGASLDLLLCRPGGGLNISIVGVLEAGKTVLLNCIAERVTAASDALLVKIDVSDKGDGERHLWGPACHLTAFGPAERGRAVQIMNLMLRIMQWRASQPRTGANWVPSPANPHIVILVDEIDEAVRVRAFKAALERLASKGRQYGFTIARAGQRATSDWTGGANVRAMDRVVCIGAVNRSGEAYHAAGSLGLALPDMSTYGEGKPGVWAFTGIGGGWSKGRVFLLDEPSDNRRLAEERAFAQPELHPDCRAFLGEMYEDLLSTDVFALWARGREGDGPEPPPQPSAEPRPQDSGESAAPAPSPSPVAVLGGIDHLDFDMDPDARERLAEIDRKNAATRRMLAETRAMPPPPPVSREAMDAHTAARWKQAAEETVIPPEMRERMLALLAGGGMSGRKLTEALGPEVKRADVMWWLHRLRHEGLIESAGKGPASRFRLKAGDSP